MLRWRNEAIAAAGDIYDEPVAVTPIAQRAPQRGHVDRKVGRFDKYARPNPTHQFFFADQFTWPFKQHNQDFESATPEADRIVTFE